LKVLKVLNPLDPTKIEDMIEGVGTNMRKFQTQNISSLEGD
jgi:hypothetical protein